MKSRSLLTVALCIAFCSGTFAQTQDMDKQLSDLTEKLAAKIKTSGKKKITVLDFTDLDGVTSDLGKYVAEQLTVNFVMGDREFTVVDRANLKKILAEHKLTASGLIDPENAKKLGLFSGVDALILGNLVPMTPNVKLTAKIITTDTADIIGGGQCTFKSDENIQQLLSRVSTESNAEAKSDGKGEDAKKVNPKYVNTFGDLSVTFEGLKGMQDGSFAIGLVFRNKNSKKAIAVGMYTVACFVAPCDLRSSLLGADGTQWHSDTSSLVGIRGITTNPKYLTAIEPGGELKTALRFYTNDRISDSLTSLKLQAEVVVNADYTESQYDNYQVVNESLPPSCKIVNVTIDIPVTNTKK